MNSEAWQTTVHGVTKSQTRLCKIVLFLRSLKTLLHRLVESINSIAEEKFTTNLIHIFLVLLFICFKLCKLLETYFYSQYYELLLGHFGDFFSYILNGRLQVHLIQ